MQVKYMGNTMHAILLYDVDFMCTEGLNLQTRPQGLTHLQPGFAGGRGDMVVLIGDALEAYPPVTDFTASACGDARLPSRFIGLWGPADAGLCLLLEYICE